MAPVILIGVGGTGVKIVAEVRRGVDLAIASAGDTVAARQAASQLRLFAVDTTPDPAMSGFEKDETCVMPANPFGINRQVEALYESGAYPHFRLRWPANGHGPYKPNDFDHGSGGMRAKSFLALLLDEIAPDRTRPLAQRVAREAESLRSALGPAAGATIESTRVIIAASLGGGTGSGIVPALALHLHEALPDHCKLIGAFMLASVTSKVQHEAEGAFGWANTWAALAELDFFQRSSAFRPGDVTPALQLPGAMGAIAGDTPPFAWCYLFGAMNTKVLSLPAYDDAVRLVAGCLVAEYFSPVADKIDTPDAQFARLFNDAPMHHGHPASFASMGRADLVYPAHRIVRHLGQRLGVQTLRQRLGGDGDEVEAAREAGRDAADRFIEANALLWKQGNALDKKLEPTGRVMASMPTLKVDNAEFRNEARDDALRLARKRATAFDTWLAQAFGPAVQANAQEVVAAAVSGLPATAKERGRLAAGGAIAAFLHKELGAAGGVGLPRAMAAADRLQMRIEAQRDLASETLKGKAWATGRGAGGETKRRDDLRADQKKRLTELGNGFRLVSPRGGRAKETFVRQWWTPWTNAEREVVVIENAIEVYEALLTAIDAMQKALTAIATAVAGLADDLEVEMAHGLGNRAHGGVLDVDVLAEPALVDRYFDEAFTAALARIGDVAGALLTDPARGIQPALRRWLEAGAATSRFGDLPALLEEILTEQGKALFTDEITRLSVWDALSAEVETREAINLIDADLQQAQKLVGEQTTELQRAGQSNVRASRVLLREFIVQRLQVCQRRAMPFWLLDESVVKTYQLPGEQRPYPVSVLAFDSAAYDAFLKSQGLDDLMPAIATQLGVAPRDLPGKHSVTIYTREGGCPLFYLDHRERKELMENGRAIGQHRFLFTDQRFQGVIDGDLTPPKIEAPGAGKGHA